MLIIGGLGAAAYLAATGFNTKNAVVNLEYTNPKVTLTKVKFGNIELQMTIDFRNNSSQNVSMDYFTGNVNYQGKLLSSFTFDGNGKNIVIAARKTTTVPLTVIVKNLGALQTIAALVRALAAKKGIATIINIDSRFYAAGIDIPVNFDWDLKTNSLATTSKKVAGIGGVGSFKKIINIGDSVHLKNVPEAKGIVGHKNAEGYYVKFKDGSDGYFDGKDLIVSNTTSKKVAGIGSVYGKLREVKVLFDDGNVIHTNMAAHLTDKEIYNYYKKGRVFNLGKGEKDYLSKVKDVKIISGVNKYGFSKN